jgi:protein SCO1/2
MNSVLNTIGAALTGVTTLYHATDGLSALTTEGARRLAVAEKALPVPDFKVEDMAGVMQSLRPQGNETVLVEFIYTTCPTICQTAGGDFEALRDEIAQRDTKVRMLSISFDPANDTLDALAGYAELHRATGEPWTVARVSPDSRKGILDFFHVIVIPDEWGGYQHNAAVLLIKPDGRFSGVFDTWAISQIAEEVAR